MKKLYRRDMRPALLERKKQLPMQMDAGRVRCRRKEERKKEERREKLIPPAMTDNECIRRWGMLQFASMFFLSLFDDDAVEMRSPGSKISSL